MRYERISMSNGQPNKPPYMDAYLLDTAADHPYFPSRPAVIICPGGGYEFVSPREGEPVAMRFLAAGFHAFVLEYSVAPARFPTALAELANAVKTVRGERRGMEDRRRSDLYHGLFGRRAFVRLAGHAVEPPDIGKRAGISVRAQALEAGRYAAVLPPCSRWAKTRTRAPGITFLRISRRRQ